MVRECLLHLKQTSRTNPDPTPITRTLPEPVEGHCENAPEPVEGDCNNAP